LLRDESVSGVTAEPPPGQSGAPTYARLFAVALFVTHVIAFLVLLLLKHPKLRLLPERPPLC
jgi:hypothetical protein